MSDDVQQGERDGAVQVYWRPGCPHCDRLLRGLSQAKIDVLLRNIWEDTNARDYVRLHNNGNETVPTISYHGQVLTNPTTGEVLALIAGT